MKNLKYILLILILVNSWSCNEDEWLREEPLSFTSPANSYKTASQFRQALNFLYDNLREMYWVTGDQHVIMYFGDQAYGGTDYPDQKFNNFETWITPSTYIPGTYWNRGYQSIANANTIINRIGLTDQVSDEAKAQIEGEALFFRAYWYNFLANLFGGVPINLEEPSVPRRDFERATQQETYEQARTDLEKALLLLPDITDEAVMDGMVSLQAAQHLLAEVNISLGDYDAAIAAASAVIGHPAMALMTSRFGSSASMPGDPYWDLFQNNNQNRAMGNTEAIWVLQYDHLNSGSSYSLYHPRFLLPFYLDCKVDNGSGTLVNAFVGLSEDKGGRGIGVYHPTHHFLEEIWGTDGTNDYRNSPYIIVRDYKINNPDAAGYDQWLVADGWLQDEDTLRKFYPFLLKFARTYDLPDDVYAKDENGAIALTPLGEKMTAYSFGELSSNCSLKDEYLYRLAGTYLLRAEAYLKNNQPDMALEDINTIRARANATPAQLSDMTLDYLMDEQLRELYFEDFRLITLNRMGTVVERTRRYNPNGYNIMDYQDLWPIPYSEIEQNIFGNLEQNPGYPQ